MNNNITPFLFGESTIRTVVIEETPWFVAKDICTALGISNYRQAISGNEQAGALGLDEDEKGVYNLDTLGGAQDHVIINESGLYALIFKSRKPEARAFRKWVTAEVLPTIRKKGYYSRRGEQILSFVKDLIALGVSPKDASILARGEFPPLSRHEQRMEELKLINEQTGAGFAPLDSEALHYLSIMRPGDEYGMSDFFEALPPKHSLRKKSKHGWQSAIGITLQHLVKAGKIVRDDRARHATYRLAESQEKVIPIQH